MHFTFLLFYLFTFLLLKEHVADSYRRNHSSHVGEQSAGYCVAGIAYAYAAEVDGEDVKGGVGRALEAMEKRAQAYQKYNNAAMAEMLIKVLPDIAGKIAEPLTQIDKITIIGGSDGSNGVDQVAGNVPAVMTKLFETMKETVGIDLAEVVKAGTYDAKVNRNITINADGAKQAAEVLKQETAAEASAEIAE